MPTTDSRPLVISDEELKSINIAISTRYGLDFSHYEPTSLKRRVARIIHKFELDGVMGLWQKLLYDKEFIDLFRDEISVGLTEMFRNAEVWELLKNEVIPALPSSFRIWHAGISTGEEVYSMAILLNELNKTDNAELIATDLSSKFVASSEAGIYDNEQLSKYAKNYQLFNPFGNFRSYFSTEGNTGTVVGKLKKNIKFSQHNVMAEGPPGKFDIIFCRNVMIYFNDYLKLKTLEKFNNQLNENGLLLIGYFDAMPDGYNSFFKYYNHSFKIFKKV